MELRVELLGVRLLGHTNMPLLEIPLQPGLTALVGRNGAGKSRLLACMERALAGTGTPGVTSHVLFRVVVGDHDPRTEGLMPTFRPRPSVEIGSPQSSDALALARAEIIDRAMEFAGSRQGQRPSLGPESTNYSEGVDSDILRALIEQAEEQAREERRHRHDTWIDPVTVGESLAQAATFCWMQHGAGEAELWAAIDPTTELPARQMLEDLAELADHASNEYDSLEEAMGEMFDAGDDVTFEYFDALYGWHPSTGFSTQWGPLPVPVLPLESVMQRPRGIAVLTDEVDLEAVLLNTRKFLGHMIKEDALLANWLAVAPAPDEDDDDADSDRENAYWAADNASVEPWPPAAITALSESATQNLSTILPGAPRLQCRLASMHRWLSEDPLAWWAQDTPSGEWIPIRDLSASQQRWARLAIARATPFQGMASSLGSFAFFDEPEAGLHRAAELGFAQGLAALTRADGTSVVVATHSPLVAASATTVIEVFRDERGRVAARTLSDELFDRIEAMGMLKQDVLSWTRAILLVEGHHDQLIVESVLGDVLRSERVLVLPIGGIKERDGVVNAEALTHFAHRPMIMLIDGLGAKVEQTWRKAQEISSAGQDKELKALFSALEREHPGYEGQFVAAAGRRLAAQGRMDELTLMCLSVPDVLELLPASAFRDGWEWDSLHSEHRRNRRDGEAFKAYLTRAHNAYFSNKAIERALSTAIPDLDAIPEDLLRLKAVIDDVVASTSAGKPESI